MTMPVRDCFGYVGEEFEDLALSHFRNEWRRDHRNSAKIARRRREVARDTHITRRAAQQDRHAPIRGLHRTAKQLRALVRRHSRKFAIGAADQQSIVAERDGALDVLGQTGKVERTVLVKRGDDNIENAVQV
jgi:hypothetical protein